MSVISGSVINFAQHKTFRSFVILYALMSVMILLLLSALYYRYSKELMLSEHRLAMQLQSERYVPQLKRWMQGDTDIFPIDLAYPTALFDASKRPIHSLLENQHIDFKRVISLDGAFIHFVVPLASHELGENYVVFETRDDGLWKRHFWFRVLLAGGLLLLLLLAVGWYLSRLFFRPLQEAIALLDDFIKDTTHELNTPVSAILTNVEMIEAEQLDAKTQNKLRRIEIAARTISTIYDDLTYLLLSHQRQTHDESLNVSLLLQERIEYFKLKALQKNLHIICNIDADVMLRCDRVKMARLIDNLISNAVKYNKNGGTITYELTSRRLVVEDSGVGIEAENIDAIFQRYTRANTHEGGFGIGLHIVFKIAKEYGYTIDVSSTPKKGSRFEIIF
ncbi:MAG: sensor histidine kinase [Sulfurimonas sp.]|nr:MAG: sensor histidine kinase [Sulfurimonas sp.]